MVLHQSIRTLESEINLNPHIRVFSLNLTKVIFNDLHCQVLLKAWVQDLAIRHPYLKFFGSYGVNHPNLFTFQEIGLLSLLPMELKGNKTVEEAFDQKQRLVSFSASEGQRVPSLVPFAAFSVVKLLDAPYSTSIIKKNHLMVAINEALLNVKQWAYNSISVENDQQQWWLVASLNSYNDKLQVIVYDLGFSLVSQFKKQHVNKSSLLRSQLKVNLKSPDCDLIHAALLMGEDKYRGNIVKSGRRRGLKQMKELPKYFKEGNFVIRSGSGACALKNSTVNNLLDNTIMKYSLTTYIPGTMVSWEIQL